jgi:hypothetical protein
MPGLSLNETRKNDPVCRADQKPCPQSVQKRASRKAMTPQPGQLLCVLAMSNPHSAQKRPPELAELQLGHN